MNKYISDTMALVLRLEKRKMPKKVKEKFVQTEKGKSEIVIPAIVFAEIGYLSEKKRIDTNLRETRIYIDKHPFVNENPLNLSTVRQAFNIDDISELHDRLIAAVGKEMNIPILTNDPDMQVSEYVMTIW